MGDESKSDIASAFQTIALHGEGHEKPFRTHNFPIFQTSTFYFDSPEQGAAAFGGTGDAHMYTRIGNPTVEAFETVMGKLEHAAGAIAFGSGMAAITAGVMAFVSSGDHVVYGDTLYGPAIHLFNDVFSRFGIESTIVDTSDVAKVKAALRPNTKMVYLETPANPTNKISDIAEIAKLHDNILVVVDNTFSTPYFQRPLEHGADVVLHSLTKYLNGHGDVVGGVVCGKTDALNAAVRTWRKDTGAILSPFDSWLVLRGLRTLGVRMEAHQRSGLRVAEYLKKHPKVKTVLHPGLPDFPGHEVACRQMTGFGSTFSFELETFEQARDLLRHLHICTLAVSLGNVDTLIEHPASMTHASVPEAIMREQGMTPEMVRISVGLEAVDDIIADLEQALEKV